MSYKILFIVVAILLISAGSYFYVQSQPKKTTPEQIQTQSINYSKLKMKELNELIQKDSNLIIIDVRTPYEYTQGHIPKSKNIDVNGTNFKEEISKLDKNQKYAVYCRSGTRSLNAYNKMIDLRFKNLYNVDQGFGAWEQLGLPIEK